MSAPRRRGKRLETWTKLFLRSSNLFQSTPPFSAIRPTELLHRHSRRRRPAPPPYSPSPPCSTALLAVAALLHRPTRRRRPTPPQSSSQTYSTDRDWLERGFDRGVWPEHTADCVSSTAIVTVPSSRVSRRRGWWRIGDERRLVEDRSGVGKMGRGFKLIRKQTPPKALLAEVWSTSSAKDVCRRGPQTADVLPLKKQTPPK
ncbi:hypothetical protein E3N88_23660 [Mikania micrantha]|uniref:Uncharacterized protein n=1 Tax=Mikania micrantha TaxID=192012 RepID=A0A5N6NF06_9ASTR|nr:hypothetical protein E3N88_23660 [Mikania micrantha]